VSSTRVSFLFEVILGLTGEKMLVNMDDIFDESQVLPVVSVRYQGSILDVALGTFAKKGGLGSSIPPEF